ncbi:MAG: LysR family transcriptional regulator [Pseudomonadota bacterium]
MNLHGIDLNLLVALDALLDLQNVTRAGEKLHVSQSAMSGSLARLREHFQDPLLVPVGRRFQRTFLADELVRPVRALLLQAEAVFKTQPRFSAAESTRVFKVMASDYGSNVAVAEVLRRVKDAAPGVGVEVVPFSDAPGQSLEEGDIDALIIARDYLAPRHPYEVLFTDTFACVVWCDNPVVGECITLAQFLALGHVVVKYGKHSIAHIEEKFFHSAGVGRRVEVTVSSFSAVPQFIVGTHRIAIMHRRLAVNYAKTMPLRLLRPPMAMPAVDECMQWHAYRDNDPGGAWFRTQLALAAGELKRADPVP